MREGCRTLPKTVHLSENTGVQASQLDQSVVTGAMPVKAVRIEGNEVAVRV